MIYPIPNQPRGGTMKLRALRFFAVCCFAGRPLAAFGDEDDAEEGSATTVETTEPNESGNASSTATGQSEARLDEPTTLRVTAGLQGLPYMTFIVAMEEGLFEENNLEVELVEVAGTNAVAAVAAGQADVTITLPENIENARAKGSDLTIIGEIGRASGRGRGCQYV